MKAVGYVRTNKAGTEGKQDWDRQVEMITAYSIRHNLELVETYYQEPMPEDIIGHEGLLKALAHDADSIVVAELNILTSHMDGVINIPTWLKNHGKRIITVQQERGKHIFEPSDESFEEELVGALTNSLVALALSR